MSPATPPPPPPLPSPTPLHALQVCAAPIQPDLVLIDVELSDMAGTELIRQIRQATWIGPIPLVLLSALADDIDRVVAFELGADDYLSRPIDSRELTLRVRAILRRSYGGPGAARELRAGKLRVDRDSHRVWLNAESVELTQIEFRLLEVLMTRRGRAQPRDRLLQDVWGRASEASVRTVDTHIRRLREKLGSAANYIRTIRGVGYSFGDQEQQDELEDEDDAGS